MGARGGCMRCVDEGVDTSGWMGEGRGEEKINEYMIWVRICIDWIKLDTWDGLGGNGILILIRTVLGYWDWRKIPLDYFVSRIRECIFLWKRLDWMDGIGILDC